MPDPATAVFNWPGAGRLLAFSYTPTVGISPQAAFCRCVPEDAAPSLTGSLVFGDSNLTITLDDCYIAPNGFREVRTAQGRVWELYIYDRRWRWEIGEAIEGNYNQLDERGKLIPYTIRSPYQLARLCLEKMGEDDFTINLPPGLAVPGNPALGIPPPGPGDVIVNPIQEYLQLGQNVPQTGTNSQAIWSAIPAARALANLCDTYGRVVVWDPITDRVSLEILGSGTGLPEGPVLVQSPAIDPKAIPQALRMVGQPTRLQIRLAFRPVGRDWDDSWQAPSELTYAPTRDGQAMVVVCRGSDITINGTEFAGAAVDMEAAINADPDLAGNVTASVVSGVLVVSAIVNGYEFEASSSSSADIACTHGPVPDNVEPGVPQGRGFEYVLPSFFPTVQATARLSYQQSLDLASQSMFRCYQLIPDDPSTAFDSSAPITGIPIPIPKNAPGAFEPLEVLRNRYRLVLQNSRPQQIVPRPGDVNRVDPLTGQPWPVEVYNGYSKDRRPQAFGSLHVSITNGGLYTNFDGLYFANTPKREAFFVDFSILDLERQVIQFSKPIYRILGGAKAWPNNTAFPSGIVVGKFAVLPPDLVIETGVAYIQDGTYAHYRFEKEYPIPGGLGPVRTVLMDDIQEEWIGAYTDYHELTTSDPYDADAENRANYYAAALIAQYQLTGAAVNTYPGVVGISLSGLVRQVTWSLERTGFTTTGNANSEFSTAVIPYPARRRRENLPPDELQARQNIQSQPGIRGTTRNVIASFGGPAGSRHQPGG